MSIWEDRFTSHAVFTTLKNLANAVTRARSTQPERDAIEAIDRIRNVQSHIERRLSGCDPALAPLTQLSSINQHVQQAVNEINSYASNKNVGHLNNANNHLDNAVSQVQLIPAIEVDKDAEGVHKAVVRFRRSAGQHLSRLEKRIAELKQQIASGSQTLSSHNQTIEQQRTKLDQAQQQFSTEFANSEKERTVEFADLITSSKEQLQTQLADSAEELAQKIGAVDTKLTQTIRTAKSQTEKGVEQLEGYLVRARDIVGLIATTGMAGGYEQAATQERKRADTFRWITVAAIAGIIAFSVYALVSTVRTGFDAEAFVAKVFVSLTFGVLAAYAGRESERHRRRERANARLQLELASIDSYLESLPREEANAIKAAIADRIFGQPEAPSKEADGSFRPPSLLEFLKVLGVEKS